MEKIAMILRKPPYGDINAAEAVRHALGAVSGDIAVSLILVDGGVTLQEKARMTRAQASPTSNRR